ncbi:MAG: hypothetical protein AAF558_10945 [Verrucomicrobiota bacterium]
MNQKEKEIRRTILSNPLDWITLTPAFLGLASILGGWAVGDWGILAMAAGASLCLISMGIYINRLVFGWSAEYARLINEWRKSIEGERDSKLDNLYRELGRDGDPRTESLLQDLRTLAKALIREESDSLAYNAFDVVSNVDKLFQRSVDYLEEGLDLWKTAEQIQNVSIKQTLLEQREALIEEVEQSLESLGQLVGQMKKTSINSGNQQALAEMREELDARLRIAEEVESRMNLMRKTTTKEDEETYLRHAE